MSQESVRVVRRMYEAFNRGDLDAVVADIAPDAVYVPTGTIPGFAGVYQGGEGFRRFLSWLWEEFDEPHIEVHEIIEAGSQVLVALTNRGRGKQSGADVSWACLAGRHGAGRQGRAGAGIHKQGRSPRSRGAI